MLGLSGFGQSSLISGQTDFKIKAERYAGFDSFGYYYFITNEVFIKANTEGSVEYKNVALGRISRADILNPLLIVLFYESFNTVVLLDNQLNEIRRINFSELDDPLILRAVGLASQNRLWVYDDQTRRVGLYDFQNDEFRVAGTALLENIVYYESDFNYFRWVDRNGSAYVMDVFGKISAFYGKVNSDIRFVGNSGWMSVAGRKIIYEDVANNKISEVAEIDNSFKNFYVKDDILSIFTSRGITNHKFKKP